MKYQYAIVINPGMDNEEEVARVETWEAACIILDENTWDEQTDIMRILPDGSLTTEF